MRFRLKQETLVTLMLHTTVNSYQWLVLNGTFCKQTALSDHKSEN